MPASRRARPTIRCLVDDLDLDLPGLNVDLGEIDHPLLEEIRRLAKTSPRGHKQGNLLPTADDYLRDRAEAVIRLQRGLTAELLGLIDQGLAAPGSEYKRDLGDWLPCRVLVLEGGGVHEIWCALGTRAIDGTGVEPQLRDRLLAAIEHHVAPALFEPRSEWPIGPANWAEVVVLGLR